MNVIYGNNIFVQSKEGDFAILGHNSECFETSQFCSGMCTKSPDGLEVSEGELGAKEGTIS